MATINPYPKDWKEARRCRAFDLKQEGWTQQEITEALGVSKGAVSQWMRSVRAQGVEALCARPHTGSPRKLRDTQFRLIPDLLSHGAEAYGFRGEVWTCARVAKVIEQEFEVSYHPSHVSRLLKQLNWTPQKPLRRAAQRDEALIVHWCTAVWPELKQRARQERRTLVFVDEAGFYLLPGVVKTYAPCSQTPILRVIQTHDHLSVMSGVTSAGQLYYAGA